MVITTATTRSVASLVQKVSSSTDASEITMISAERIRSVRMAPEISSRSASGPTSATGFSWSSCPLNRCQILWAPS